MRNLINFFIKNFTWIVFLFYVVVSCALLFSGNPYQHHVYMSSAGAVTASVYEAANNVTSYFHLRGINEDLQRRNAALELEVIGLKDKIRAYEAKAYADTMTVDSALSRYSFIIAHVINNSVTRPCNYITIEKGRLDGVRPEMGVVDQNGVVGIVNIVGDHTARVISLLNPNLKISCKVKGNDHVGSLVWDGVDPRTAVLEELPRHAVFHRGDTIVTSGFSSVFPEGVPVGTVLSDARGHDGDFFALKIRLFTDFSTLSTVRVVGDAMMHELREVEKDIDEAQ